MRTVVVLFNRDLRVHDHPALAQAHAVADRVVPLFVLDDAILGSGFAAPNRVRFLLESLADLRSSLRTRDADLVVRRGDVVAETMAVMEATGATEVFASADYPVYAKHRERRLAEAGADLTTFDGVSIVAPDDIRTGGGEHYKVFTPYWRQWQRAPRRAVAATPRRITTAAGLDPGPLPDWRSLVDGEPSPGVVPGGETEGRKRVHRWMRRSLDRYDDHHDDLAADDTSRLSPYLHFGCLSPLEVSLAADRHEGFVRQLCWRDFHHQVADAHPAIASEDYRPRGRRWTRDAEALTAWKEGRTGVPLVDAGMRQLRHEGWMHNRARLVTASYLTKTLGIDWREGAAHFLHWLVDGDIVDNSANWQWVAGTGNDTRPNRVLNPERQRQRFDPDGAYIRRWCGDDALAGDGDAPTLPFA
jgi:deoxyribodipyrimidine photo-lyase